MARADTETEALVMAAVNQFITAFTEGNVDGILALFAPDPDVVVIGTGVDEKRIGFAEIKALFERDFTQSEEQSIQLGWYSVSVKGSIAWVASDGIARTKVGGQETSFPVRLTVVLEQRRDRWLIVQLHGSLPAAGQKEGEGWPTGSS